MKHIDQIVFVNIATQGYFQNLPEFRVGFLNSTSLAKFNGIMFQLTKPISKGKGFDTIAVGGRYDDLLKNYIYKQKMENIGAVGISFNFDRLKEALARKEENVGVYDVLICCTSDLNNTSHSLFQLACNLRKLEFKVDIIFSSNLSSNDINELLRRRGVGHVLTAHPTKDDFECKVGQKISGQNY